MYGQEDEKIREIVQNLRRYLWHLIEKYHS